MTSKLKKFENVLYRGCKDEVLYGKRGDRVGSGPCEGTSCEKTNRDI